MKKGLAIDHMKKTTSLSVGYKCCVISKPTLEPSDWGQKGSGEQKKTIDAVDEEDLQ